VSSWKKVLLDLGEIRQGKRKRIIFTADNTIKGIKDISASCGCTKADYNKETNELKIVYTPKKIPPHLTIQGFYETYKYLTITYIDGEKEVLTFKAKIIK
jgi:hypothetical protein